MRCDYCGKDAHLDRYTLAKRTLAPINPKTGYEKFCLFLYHENKIMNVCRGCHSQNMRDIIAFKKEWNKGVSNEQKMEQIEVFCLENLLKILKKQLKA